MTTSFLVRASRSLSMVALLAALGMSSACPAATDTIVDVPAVDDVCTENEECGDGFICSTGVCVAGSCDPIVEAACDADATGKFCCELWQNCDAITLTCVRDPESNIGCLPSEPDCTPCSESEDCPGIGAFCSAGRCFLAGDRAPCSLDFQCGSGERCDRTEFRCVPDNGGCRFCDQLAELCCEDGKTCDTENGFCVDPSGDTCADDDDCSLGLFCGDADICVQCQTTDDCGPGLECNAGTGRCFSVASQCTRDDDEENGGCPGQKRCNLLIQECVVPTCESDSECTAGDFFEPGDSRRRCNLETFSCFLPPPVCSENDEPNNTTDDALELSEQLTYSGKLCRSDTDVLSFPTEPLTRYTVTLTVAGGRSAGIAAQLVDELGAVESTATITGTQTSITLVGATGVDQAGDFYLRVSAGSAQALDVWNYAVSVTQIAISELPDCTTAGQKNQEPNNTGADAIPLVLGADARRLSRCGTSDIDIFKVDVPRLRGVKVTLDNFVNGEGNLDVEIRKTESLSGAAAASGRSSSNQEIVTAPEGVLTYYIVVQLASTSGVLNEQAYSLKVEEVARPVACGEPELNEDDGLPAFAVPIVLVADGETGSFDARVDDLVRCNAQDEDYYRVTVPAEVGGAFILEFSHNIANLALDQTDDQGVTLETDNTSSSTRSFERIDIAPSATEQVLLFKVRAAVATLSVAQPYSVVVSTYAAAQCIASEPTPDDAYVSARCVGDFVDEALPCPGERLPHPLGSDLAQCTEAAPPAGCGALCGNDDEDLYRLGALLKNQIIQGRLTFDPALGKADVRILRRSSLVPQPTASGLRTFLDTGAAAGDGVIDFEYLVDGSTTVGLEHIVAVRADGDAGHFAQPYALDLSVTPPCIADAFEGDGGNGSVESAVTTRDPPAPATDVDATICISDVDVYELGVLPSETLTFRLLGPVGTRLRIGRAPTDPTDTMPEFIDGEAATVVDAATAITVVHPDSAFGFFYAVVDRVAGAGTGPYTLEVDIAD